MEQTSGTGKAVETDIKTRRFLIKLVNELCALRATRIVLELNKPDLLISFNDASGSKKIVKVTPGWLETLPAYLKDSWFCLDDQLPSRSTDRPGSTFKAAVQVGAHFAIFRVRLSTDKIDLNEFEFVSWQSIGSFLHMDTVSSAVLKDFELRPEGVLILSSPSAECLHKARSTWTALTGQHYLGDLKQPNVRKALQGLAGRDLYGASLIADSPAQALQSISNYQDLLNLSVPTYLVFSSFPKAICPDCPGTMRLAVNQFILDSKKEQIDWSDKKPSIEQLCNGCDGYGYKGWESACQIIELDTALKTELSTRPSLPQLEVWLNSTGYARYYDLAVELALDGKTDVAALQYCGLRQTTGAENAANGLPVEDDFFESVKNPPGGAAETQILVVEDDLDQRQILEMALEDMGYSVLLAENGLEALGVLQTAQPHLIITDLMMPKMNGMDFVKNLKGQERFKDIGVMVLTVLNDPDKEYSLLDLGVEDYCEKTTPRKVLLKRIENVVKRKALDREDREQGIAQ